MRALVLRGHGDVSMLEVTDVPAPELSGPGDVRIALRAGALNHLDLFTMKGLAGLRLHFPHVLGGDGAGVVESVGAGVTAVQPGDRVLFNPGVSCYACEQCLAGEHSQCIRYQLIGEHLPGTLAEYIVVPQQNVARIPTPPDPHPPVSWAEAAAYSLATLTAWRMLHTRAKVQPGETVLIWGVGGGVGSIAVSIAKLLGASVIVTSSSDEKLKVAREMGADVTLNHDAVDVAQEVRQVTDKRGADVIVDNVGEATWERSLLALGKGGRLVTCGATTGAKVVSDVRRVFWNQYTIMGSTMGSAADYADIIRLLGEGTLRARVDSTFPLERGVEALERLRDGKQMGKIVVEVSKE
jgi:NADPH:quinone reductase-like Zn-dependent oxidoreductase